MRRPLRTTRHPTPPRPNTPPTPTRRPHTSHPAGAQPRRCRPHPGHAITPAHGTKTPPHPSGCEGLALCRTVPKEVRRPATAQCLRRSKDLPGYRAPPRRRLPLALRRSRHANPTADWARGTRTGRALATQEPLQRGTRYRHTPADARRPGLEEEQPPPPPRYPWFSNLPRLRYRSLPLQERAPPQTNPPPRDVPAPLLPLLSTEAPPVQDHHPTHNASPNPETTPRPREHDRPH
uniref:Uncharacterized protein n=1 Tax=Rhodococcus hoagii TaxID=43767 RepID=A0A1Z1UW84_RHOHA|nr:hypothetical protein pVAPN1354_0001 [Prescottella equi]ARX59895.1 hypothetical protein pVAPN1557_0001 [Prescottella equi]